MKHLIALALMIASTTSMAASYCPNFPEKTWAELASSVVRNILKEEYGVTAKQITYNLAKSRVLTSAAEKVVVLSNVQIVTAKQNTLIPSADYYSSITNFDDGLGKRDIVVYINRRTIPAEYDSEGAIKKPSYKECRVDINTSFVNAKTNVPVSRK